MPIDENAFAVSCSVTVTDECEKQVTKTGDKARNWMTMFQNWSTKDEIETSIRTFQSVRETYISVRGTTKLKTHFLKLNEEMTKMGGKTYTDVLSCMLP